MPPKGVKSAKRKRQYEKIKASARKQGRSAGAAKRIAAATTNKTRARKGETKGGRKRAAGGSRKSSGARKSTSSSRKTSSRKSSTRKSSRSRKSSSSKKR